MFPLSSSVDNKFERAFELACGMEKASYRVFPVMMGRTLTALCSTTRICAFDFNELCNTEKGAADYKALCDNFISFFATPYSLYVYIREYVSWCNLN